jgi:[protein-PII] uridylyltransferase
MTSPFERARAKLLKLLGGQSTAGGAEASASIPDLPADAWNAEHLRLMLSPTPGVTKRLAELEKRNVLALLLPNVEGYKCPSDRAVAAVQALEQLLEETTLAAKRFGAILRELSAPDLLVLSLLLRDVALGQADETARAAQGSFDHLRLEPDERALVEFLIRDDSRMAQVALGPDADDAQNVEAFATYLSTAALFNAFGPEEHLRMLCLMTLATLDAEGALTPLKSELLWRLFVDTYNELMKAYGDEVIDVKTVTRSALNATRPEDISEAELIQILEGLPKRYFTLFDSEHIYEHVRLCRNMAADDVHFFLAREGDTWELSVATLDKPFLFSNVCGVLSYLDLDIQDGQALTSTRGLVLDLFKIGSPQGALTRSALDPLLPDVVRGRADIAALLVRKHATVPVPSRPRVGPVIAFDNDASHRYTVLEIVAVDTPGLLYRISRALSTFQCEIEMVVISTEEDKAVDIFHVKKNGAKLTQVDELPLTEALEQALAGSLA